MPLQSATIPPPVGGWNTRDPLEFMDPADAIELTNIFPETGDVKIRNGFSTHVTSGMGSGAVETLAVYNPKDGTNKMLAITNSNIYDVTSAPSATQLTSSADDYWQYVNFNDELIMVNGTDTPRTYDGTSVTNVTYTGVSDPTKLIDITVYKDRLYFIEDATRSIWYGGNQSSSGALTELDLSFVLRDGGKAQAIGSLSRDTGSGIDNLFVVISDEGELLVYSGLNPGDASWGLVGRFYIPKPLGQRCFVNVDTELYVLTVDGVFPVSKLLAEQPVQATSTIVTDKIRDTFANAGRNYVSNVGWQAIPYPRGKYFLINIPLSTNTQFEQYVANTQTGAWTKFTGMNGPSWVVFNNNLYFGTTDGKVMKADDGTDDNGDNIDVDIKWAFNYFDDRARVKRFSLAKLIVIGESSVDFNFNINVDFEDETPAGTVSVSGNAGTAWDTGPWDTSSWDTSDVYKADWRSVTGIGRAMSLRLSGGFQNAPFRLSTAQIMYETGGAL